MGGDHWIDGVGRRWRTGILGIGALLSLGAFLFAVQLLGTATGAAADPLERLFAQYVGSPGSAVGVGWLATYAITNGSVVAAIAVSLFQASVLTGQQLFLLISGSRLGGAAIVVLIGAFDYLQKRRYTFGEATGLGTLTFLLTYAVYLPATVGGYLVLPHVQSILERTATRYTITIESLSVFESVCDGIVAAIGVGPGLLTAVGLLFGSLTLFDRVLERVETEWLRDRLFRHFERRWVAFALGVLITGITTSVAFSLGVIVPLYNRGYVKRREIVPYVLGANVGTLFDTLVVAVLLESTAGVAIVLTVVILATFVTIVLLIAFRPFHRSIGILQSRLVDDRRYLTGFLLSLLLVPLGLVLLPV